ncbi:MAG: hypothetical protein JW724_00660 [Candidatus Altiarchaeota archaeon]|nr:hypothetical protein [Candidatus Altiarchaeota archaeon]
MDVKKYSTILIGLFMVLASSVFADVTVSRDLPSSAAAGSTFTVTLEMTVTGTAPAAVGLTENYPAGWTVSDVSLAGIDQGDRIEWLFWAMGNPVQDQSITYDVTVPASASGTATFSGTIDTGSTTDIAGDTDVSVTGAATTTTTTTPTTTTAPLPAYASRNLPDSIKPGSSFTVTLNLMIDEDNAPNAVGVSEVFPEGWTISESSIDPAGTYFAAEHKIEWLFWAQGNPVEDTTISYTITVPSSATGTETFAGTVDYGGASDPTIGGDTEVDISSTTSKKSKRYFVVTLPDEAYANSPVEIQVADKNTKDPVNKAGIDIFLGADKNGKKVAYGMTDKNGTFTFTPEADGTYTIYVDMSKYKESKETLKVSAGEPTTTTLVVTTTKPAATTTKPPAPTTQPPAPTTKPPVPTTQPPAPTTQPPVPTTQPPTPTTTPEEPQGGISPLLIGVVVLIILVVVAYFMMKGKGKEKPKTNGKKATNGKKEEKPAEE